MSCDGREDLRFLLGSEDAEVIREKAHYERPSAISYRKGFDSAAGWSKGWIWFSSAGAVDSMRGFPNWRDDTTFRTILLHELGHVFGNIHVSGTIMDRETSRRLADRVIKREWIGKVDQTKELLMTGAGPRKTHGYLGGAGYFNAFRAFEWLTGRAAAGTIRAEYRRGSQVGDGVELAVKDDESEFIYSFSLKPAFHNPHYSADVPVFKRLMGKASISMLSEGQVLFGTLHHPAKGDVVALFETNMSSIDAIGPFGIKVLINGFPQPLFAGFPDK
jgi:hypothetical protein